MAVEDKFNINLNQNLWGLVVAYAALGIAEHLGLRRLGCLAFIASIGLTISILFTAAFYTWDYCQKRIGK
jgi:hypothetical protein